MVRLRRDRACEMRDRRTAPSGYRCVMSSTGVVREWRFGDDWGVFDSQDCPGGAYATEQSLRVEAVADLSQPTPSMGLRPGTEVEFEWTEAVEPIKGMRYLVADAWPRATTTTAPPLHSTRAFSTSLWISVGEPGPDGLTLMRQDLQKAVVAAIDCPPPDVPSTVGTVQQWFDDEGWGVLDSPSIPGGVWTHYSAVVGTGFRRLHPGQAVEFTYEHAWQDGYEFRAVSVKEL